MQTRTVVHKISEHYKVVEYQVTKDGKIVEVYYKVRDSFDNEYGDRFDELPDAISYIKNITFS